MTDRNTYMRRRYREDPLARASDRRRKPRRGYAEVTLPLLDTMIERVPADKYAAPWFYDWKKLRDDGYSVSVLVSPDGKSLVGLACRCAWW